MPTYTTWLSLYGLHIHNVFLSNRSNSTVPPLNFLLISQSSRKWSGNLRSETRNVKVVQLSEWNYVRIKFTVYLTGINLPCVLAGVGWAGFCNSFSLSRPLFCKRAANAGGKGIFSNYSIFHSPLLLFLIPFLFLVTIYALYESSCYHRPCFQGSATLILPCWSQTNWNCSNESDKFNGCPIIVSAVKCWCFSIVLLKWQSVKTRHGKHPN